MQTHVGVEPKYYHVRLDKSGRISIPSEIRERKGLKEGDTVVFENDDHGLRMMSIEEAVRQAQAYFRQLVPPGVSLAEELIAERREEAARE